MCLIVPLFACSLACLPDCLLACLCVFVALLSCCLFIQVKMDVDDFNGFLLSLLRCLVVRL